MDETELAYVFGCIKDKHNVSYYDEDETNKRNYTYSQLQVIPKKEKLNLEVQTFSFGENS